MSVGGPGTAAVPYSAAPLASLGPLAGFLSWLSRERLAIGLAASSEAVRQADRRLRMSRCLSWRTWDAGRGMSGTLERYDFFACIEPGGLSLRRSVAQWAGILALLRHCGPHGGTIPGRWCGFQPIPTGRRRKFFGVLSIPLPFYPPYFPLICNKGG